MAAHLCDFLSDKGAKAAPGEAAAPAAAPAAGAPVKRLDNLFFIEEPKNVSVTESKLTVINLRALKINIYKENHLQSLVMLALAQW